MAEYRQHDINKVFIDTVFIPQYAKHVKAIKNECLSYPSAIAEELAIRDVEIAKLEGDIKELVRVMDLTVCEEDGVQSLREWMTSGEWPEA